MDAVEPPARDFVTVIEDSRRWTHVPLRDDDIIISTPPKCGTTWTQGVVSSLLWPDGDAPDGSLSSRSPWVDVRFAPIEEIAQALAAQEHRRFIKTHSPADAVPFKPSIRHIVVYRNPADALVSWGNHRAKMHPELFTVLNELAAADGIEPIPSQFDGDYDELFQEWSRWWSPATHLPSWWLRRDQPNVLFVHYADLLADLDGEMHRMAKFLDIEVPAGSWPAVIDRCLLDSMREQARTGSSLERAFAGGADSFFYQGGNGRGSQLLSVAQQARCDDHCRSLVPDDALGWLESGSIAVGWRPEEGSDR